MPKPPLSVAVIGAGMAGRSHAAAYRMAGTVFGAGLPPIRLAAIADANTALAEGTARRYGYEKALPSWECVAEERAIEAGGGPRGPVDRRGEHRRRQRPPPADLRGTRRGRQARAVREAAGGLDGRRTGHGRPRGGRGCRHRGGLYLPPLTADRRDPRPRAQR